MRGPLDDQAEAKWQEIGDAIGVSRQGAKHIYNRAIEKLRRNPELLQYYRDSLQSDIDPTQTMIKWENRG